MGYSHETSVRCNVRDALLSAVLATAVLSFSPMADARDESGMYEQLLGRSPSGPGGYSSPRYVTFGPSEWQRPRRSRPRIARAPPKEAVPARPAVEAMAPVGWRSMILADETLRPGDVVVFPEGPKVFAGSGGPPWAQADFQEVATSRLINRKARVILLAMTGRISGDEARDGTAVASNGRKHRDLVGMKKPIKVSASDPH